MGKFVGPKFLPIMTANSNEGVFASFSALLRVMRSEHGEHDRTKANMISKT